MAKLCPSGQMGRGEPNEGFGVWESSKWERYICFDDTVCALSRAWEEKREKDGLLPLPFYPTVFVVFSV